MSQRPNLRDLRTISHTSASSAKSIRSPRVQHITGEAPPELSPLDAFALQSRLLARQLQDATKDGQRLSRLPPLTVESPLIVQGRSDYFRSMSQDSESENDDGPILSIESAAVRTEIVEPGFKQDQRPMSMHPQMSRVAPIPDAEVPALPDSARGRHLGQIEESVDFFGLSRARSPSPIQSDTQSIRTRPAGAHSPARRHHVKQPSSATISTERGMDEAAALAPPRAAFSSKRSSSNMSSPMFLADDDSQGPLSSSLQSISVRKLSSSSVAHGPPMMSPVPSSYRRSPSISSDISGLPKPSFNFSRPLSRAGTPTFEFPARQASSDSHPSFFLADESAHTPLSIRSEALHDQSMEDPSGAASKSYIYSKFTLPRGKSIQRDEPDGQGSIAPTWEQHALPPGSAPLKRPNAPPSPPLRPSSAYARTGPSDTANFLSRPSFEGGKASFDSARTAPPGQLPVMPVPSSFESFARRSEDVPRGRARGRSPPSSLANTSDTASTIRPPPSNRSAIPTAAETTPEEHLAKGIRCHEEGQLNESTYHFRLAARQNNPTAMLMYALACRHGWGMRVNQREGVEWLRKAAEHASIEIADDEDQSKEGRHVDFAENRTRKAQFALSIYELGVSHLNGWGIEQDKALALRCFEIAGSWGDVDALAEAGFCYAQGMGCKKNLKKSAKFYRMAEAKGMSMVGNSWIHKAKYSDDKEEESPKKDKDKKKSRSKSRTRSMFSRKTPKREEAAVDGAS